MAAVVPVHEESSGTPLPITPRGLALGAWTTGCCDCLDDCSSCCLTYWCPCVVVGRMAELSSDGTTDRCTGCAIWMALQYLTGCGCVYSHLFRKRLRAKYVLPEEPCIDLVLHCCCMACALCQEYRELKNRGWDPSLAYATNIAKFHAATFRSQPLDESSSHSVPPASKPETQEMAK